MSVSSATRLLVDEFRSRPTVRAGSLITTVFGDAIAPRGGSVWIGSLIRALADFGISERLVRTSVFRLSRDGWLDATQVGRRSYYSLSPGGARKFELATHRIYGEPRQQWSGEWCLVLLAGLPADARDNVRRELGWLGFGAIGGSVLVNPSPDRGDVDEAISRLGVGDQIVTLSGVTGGDAEDRALRELAQKSWDLADIDKRYTLFIERFRGVFAAVQKAGRTDPRLAFQVRTLLIQEYRRILLRDPLLPARLLPAGWHGLAAYQLCRNLYREIHVAADLFLSDNMETAEGPLPPPEPRFYDRFGGLG